MCASLNLPELGQCMRPELKELVIALRDEADWWYDIGLQLDLPEVTLNMIATHPVIRDRLRIMLSNWLQNDLEASWEKLVFVLDILGKNVTAANIRQRFASFSTDLTPQLITNMESVSSRASSKAPVRKEPVSREVEKGSVHSSVAIVSDPCYEDQITGKRKPFISY